MQDDVSTVLDRDVYVWRHEERIHGPCRSSRDPGEVSLSFIVLLFSELLNFLQVKMI